MSKSNSNFEPMMGNYVHEFSNGSHSYAIPDDITIEQDYIFYIRVEIEEVDNLCDTSRGTGGFGSTGITANK